MNVRSVKPLRRAVQTLAAAGLLCAGPASAVGLMQAYQEALMNDPSYKMAFFERESGKEYETMGRAGLLPQLSANYSASRNVTDLIGQNIFGQETLTHPKYLSRSASVSVRQTVFNFDAWSRYKQGKAQNAMSAALFDVQGRELLLRVTGAYIDALFANEQLRLAQVQRDTYAEQQKVNQRMFEKGEGTRTDMLETQARLDVAEADVIDARDNVTNALTTLSNVVGTEIKVLDELGPQFPLMPMPARTFDEWRDLAVKTNPQLLASTIAIEVAHQEVNKARAGHAPKLDFVASYTKSNADTINTYNQQTTGRALGIQLSVPLYAGGYVSAAARQAVAAEGRAKADLEGKTNDVLADLRKQFNLVQSSVTRLAALDKAVASGQLLMTATEKSIKGGVRINLDLLNAQQQLYTTQRDLARARYNYLVGSLRLLAAAGTLDGDDLRRVANYFR
jgi:protease secretion system outer membrane protein